MQGLVLMNQIHGNNVVVVGNDDIGKTISDCDGLITSDCDITLCVKVADCLPISLIDKKSHTIGLIHAGWRGLENKIIKNAIKIIGNNIEVKIGPHICSKHYETDLVKIALTQLIELGVKKENIKVSKKCTFEDPKLPSYRRDRTNERLIVKLKFNPRG